MNAPDTANKNPKAISVIFSKYVVGSRFWLRQELCRPYNTFYGHISKSGLVQMSNDQKYNMSAY